ncbi:MAG TPA: LuxR C-terminal-related transcriptional regulator [Xanthobacteraceae bacterium]|nr:LuxR C-terminal-related transcriptional regulator [Xanthobacteraceae bacterium]
MDGRRPRADVTASTPVGAIRATNQHDAERIDSEPERMLARASTMSELRTIGSAPLSPLAEAIYDGAPEPALLHDLLAGLAAAVVLVDAAGRAAFANPAARKLFDDGVIRRGASGGLALPDAQANRALREALRAPCRRAGARPTGMAIPFTAPTNARWLAQFCALVRRDQPAALAPRSPVAALHVSQLTLAPHPAVAIMVALYGLTAGEQRVLSVLLNGSGVPQAARELDLSPSTVKTHLRNLFAKTGARRQADLVRLACACAPFFA